MTTFTNTAVTSADCLYYAEQFIAMGNVAKPSIAKQTAIDWEMAHKLDLAGDKFKAEGNLKSAQVCYSRALSLATKAHNAAI
jgi:hypothetical protein